MNKVDIKTPMGLMSSPASLQLHALKPFIICIPNPQIKSTRPARHAIAVPRSFPTLACSAPDETLKLQKLAVSNSSTTKYIVSEYWYLNLWVWLGFNKSMFTSSTLVWLSLLPKLTCWSGVQTIDIPQIEHGKKIVFNKVPSFGFVSTR